MKINSWLRHFIYVLLIFIMVFWGQHVFQVIEKNRAISFDLNLYYTNTMMIIFYGSIGCILGLEHLIFEIKKEGNWKISFPRLVLIGLPSLYFSLAYIILSSNFQFLRDILLYPIFALMKSYSGFISVFPLILGYSIITSFYKCNRKVQTRVISQCRTSIIP